MDKWEYLPTKGFPIMFHAIEGESLREGLSPSYFNPQEVVQVVQYVDSLLSTTLSIPVQATDIGIITPSTKQAQKICMALQTNKISCFSSPVHNEIDSTIKTADRGIKVGSVESFQGQERRCIIISTVGTESVFAGDVYNGGGSDKQGVHENTKNAQNNNNHSTNSIDCNDDQRMHNDVDFITDGKRFNVAITRAQSLLIIVGSSRFLARDTKYWLPLMRFCNVYRSWVGDPWGKEMFITN